MKIRRIAFLLISLSSLSVRASATELTSTSMLTFPASYTFALTNLLGGPPNYQTISVDRGVAVLRNGTMFFIESPIGATCRSQDNLGSPGVLYTVGKSSFGVMNCTPVNETTSLGSVSDIVTGQYRSNLKKSGDTYVFSGSMIVTLRYKNSDNTYGGGVNLTKISTVKQSGRFRLSQGDCELIRYSDSIQIKTTNHNLKTVGIENNSVQGHAGKCKYY